MSEKMYFSLLILCGFLCQGIVQGLSGNVVRRKRVINLEPGGDVPVQGRVAPYVVTIKEFPNNWNICTGSILSKHTVITEASCVAHYDEASIKILANGAGYSYRGNTHNVVEKKVRIGRHVLSARNRDGIALLIVQPAFTYDRSTGPIALHEGALLAGAPATIFGWGYNFGNPKGTNYLYRLRSITLPIMPHRNCVNMYHGRAVITEEHICTYDPRKRCGHTDSGAPLVVDDHLAGLYVWRGTEEHHINPDVYIIVQHLEYSQWIRNNTVHDI